jgi:hypothetical protein
MAQLELDNMEYSSDALAQAAYVTNSAANLQSYSEPTIKTQGSYSLKGIAAITGSLNKTLTKTILPISNADLDDEDMSNITDWTDYDAGTGESSQITFDGKSCMKLDGGNDKAVRLKDVGSFGTRTVLSFSVYCDLIGTMAAEESFYAQIFNGTYCFDIVFASDGVYAQWAGTKVGDVVQDTWQEWTIDVNWTTKKGDFYLNGMLIAAGISFGYNTTGLPAGTVLFTQFSRTATNRISYVDWYKIGSSYICGTPINLTGINNLKLDIRASRTGSNIKVGIHDSGGTTTENTPNIITADTFQVVNLDLSEVSDANKDAIDSIIITVVNADVANTFYLDDFNIAVTDIFGYIDHEISPVNGVFGVIV